MAMIKDLTGSFDKLSLKKDPLSLSLMRIRLIQYVNCKGEMYTKVISVLFSFKEFFT